MITELRLRDFKNFHDATLRLGSFTVLVGANASGKSNIRDAFRVLHGIGRGYSMAEIIGGKYGGGGQLEWSPLRGGANEIVKSGAAAFEIGVDLEFAEGTAGKETLKSAEYLIRIEKTDASRSGFRIVAERLGIGRVSIFSIGAAPDYLDFQKKHPATLVHVGGGSKSRPPGMEWISRSAIELSGQPALSLIVGFRMGAPPTATQVQKILDALAGVRFLDLVPDVMRKPAFPGQNVLGDSGENLSTVLQEICETPDHKTILIDWIQELTPMDIVDFEFPRDPSGLVHLVLKERSGVAISAYSASDGTLRFLALLAALLGKNPAKLYFFEEIETGIHPSRLRLLLDLIEHQTAKNGIQVVTTTHSSDLLSMIGDSTFDHTSVVYRPRDTDHAIIRRVAELPDAPRLRAEQGLGSLLASGWMEDVLFFEAENEQATAK
jgi:predicted ATPase